MSEGQVKRGPIRRIVGAYHWVKALDEEREHGPPAALRRIERMEARMPLRYFERAYKAFLLFHSDRTPEADEILYALEKSLADPRNANERYVQLFCQFYGRFRDSTLEEADQIWLAAEDLRCSPMLRRYLRLYRKPSLAYANPRPPAREEERA